MSIVRVVIASPVATKTARTRRVTFAGQLANLGSLAEFVREKLLM